MKLRLEAICSGRVQGVGFRFFVELKAKFLGLSGFVQNLGDGRVQAVAEGEKKGLLEFLAALGKGPPLSHVSDVKARWSHATGEFSGFGMRH